MEITVHSISVTYNRKHLEDEMLLTALFLLLVNAIDFRKYLKTDI